MDDEMELVRAADALLAQAGFGPDGSRVELRRNLQIEFEKSVIPAGIVPQPARVATVPANYGAVPFWSWRTISRGPEQQVKSSPRPSTPPAVKSCRRDHRRARRPR